MKRIATTVAMVCMVACITCFSMALLGCSQPKSETGTFEVVGSDEGGAKPSKADAWTYENESFSIVLPSQFDGMVTVTPAFESDHIWKVGYGDIDLALVLVPQTAVIDYEDEHKMRTYNIGDACTCRLYYITTDGEHNAHWGDAGATELAVERFLGLSDREFMKCLSFPGIPGDALEPVLMMDDATAATGAVPDGAGSATVSPGEPFWGIWIGASKDETEAESMAEGARQLGFDAFVTNTVEWENLNSEPWFVISTGRYASEGDASAQLGAVQSSGYPDAYVKYSGAHQ